MHSPTKLPDLVTLYIYNEHHVLFPFKRFLFLFYVHECLPACMYMYHISAGSNRRSEEGARYPGTVVTGNCKPCGTTEFRSSPRATD